MNRALRQATLNPNLMYEKLWLAAKVIESTMEGIFVTDELGHIQIVNPAFTELTGHEPNKAVRRTPLILRSLSQQPTFNRKFWNLIKTQENWEGELWIQHKDGHSFPAHVAISALIKDKNEPIQYVVLFDDISDHKKMLAERQQMTYFDSLTSLPNRAFLMEQFKQEIAAAAANSSPLALLMLDLDRFKVINDTLGHAAGDLILQRVSTRLKNSLEGQGIVGRLGGDEFLIIANEFQSVDDLSRLAEKISACLKAPFFYGTQELHLTTSIGIALYPGDGADAPTILQHSEVALYRAKKHGRNTYQFYTASLNAKALERLVLENSLRHAIERQEFVVYYQPQVQLSTGRIIGAEALIRWQHPALGIISPTDFLPIAEESGLLTTIDNWVLEEACCQCAAWQNDGLSPAYVAVNLSTQQLQELGFDQRLASTLQRCKLNPSLLEIEMTENIIMDNPELTITTLQNLKKIGIKVGIDDFGTGYSSLSYLKRLPIDILKIDQSFVRDCIENDDDAAINTAIISMSHSLNLQVIAEGVENKNQLEFLYSLNCDGVQGYLFSPPVPVAEFIELLAKQPYLNQQAGSENISLFALPN